MKNVFIFTAPALHESLFTKKWKHDILQYCFAALQGNTKQVCRHCSLKYDYMKRWLFIVCINAALLFSCSSYPKAEDPLDAAREFIDACLKGDFDKAGFYMLQDDENKMQLEKLKGDYRTRSASEKEEYKAASINILEEDTVNDTLHIIDYKNSYDNIARKARVIQRDGAWLVDLKYTFNGNL